MSDAFQITGMNPHFKEIKSVPIPYNKGFYGNCKLDIRLDEEIKAKAEKASALLGLKSLTEYVVRLMDEDSTKVLSEHESITVEANIFDQFMAASVPLPNKKYPICSFYSIAPSSISRDTLPQAMAKKLPRYPIPVFLLAQLAVHKEFHGSGLGKVSLIKALEYLWEINSHMRAYAIVVDCLTEQAESFYAKYGFDVLCEINGRVRMFIPMKTVSQLFT